VTYIAHHRITSNLARLVALLALAIAPLALVSCETCPTPRVQSARSIVDRWVALVKPVTGGVQVSSLEGTAHVVSGTWKGYPLSLTPDLTGCASTTSDTSGPSGQDFTVWIELAGAAPLEVLRIPMDHESRATEHEAPVKVTWIRPDGRMFLVQSGHSIFRCSVCPGLVSKELITDDGVCGTASGDDVFFIDRNAPTVLRWRSTSGEEGHIDIPRALDQLEPGAKAGKVVAFQYPKSAEENVTLLAADRGDGSVKPLLRVPAGMVSFIRLPDETKAVVELWTKGKERIDGSMLTRFYLWDYVSGDLTFLRENSEGERLHPLATGFREVQVKCTE